jgi:hypothetical protein
MDQEQDSQLVEANYPVSLTEKAKSRKFIFCVGIEVLASLLVWLGSIDAGSYTQITTMNIIGYLTGNVTQAVMGKKQA